MKSRREILLELDNIQHWLKEIKEEAEKPDAVIPWIQIESMLRCANAITYEAGIINGAKLFGDRSPTAQREGRTR